jgi:hypothetical protein
MLGKKISHYVSETDKFLKSFDKQHKEKSPSQQAEIAKAEAIANKRDNADAGKDESIWSDF